MAKAFKLTCEPFIFEGSNGKHEIPSLDTLDYTAWKDVVEISMNDNRTVEETLKAYKEFFLRVCPELKDENIGDFGWMKLGNAYFGAMGE